MISLDTIEETILELESSRDTSFAACSRLAILYICRNELKGRTLSPVSDSKAASGEVPELSGSEFLKEASGVDIQSLLAVLDEHMDAVRVLYPKEYEALMGKVRSLHQTHKPQD